MVKLVDKQNIFNSGILSSKLYSRDDLKQYNNGVADAMNFICSRYGPMEKRTGTKFIWDLENPNQKVFFLPFIFSIKQTVLLEFLDHQIRFYTFDGQEFGPIASPDNPEEPYTIATPFSEDQLDDISYVQSLDVIYLAFADRITPPYTLSRYANNDWRLALFETEDGPYLDQNYSVEKKMTITDKNTTSSTVTLDGFSLNSNDVGRWIRICTPRYNENTYAYEDKWSYGKISEALGPYFLLDRKIVYTKVSNPTNGTAVYSDQAIKTQWGTVAERDSGDANNFKDYGRTFTYYRKINDNTFSWIENNTSYWVNEAERSNRQIVYTSSATPGNNTTLYLDFDLTLEYRVNYEEPVPPATVGTYTVVKVSGSTGTEYKDVKYFNTNIDEWFYYLGSIKIGNITRHQWKQAQYVYDNASYTTRKGRIQSRTDTQLTVQDFNTTQSTNSINNLRTFNQKSSSITVDWSYRNKVDEQNNDWMIEPTSEWRLGVWHNSTGNNDYPVTYPTKVTIHQQRLVWSGMTTKPWIWTSNSFAYKNYAPSDYEGEIADTNSIYYDISTDKVSDIFWLKSLKSLLIGTELGEIRMFSSGTAITPADVVSMRESSYGSFNAEPVVNDDNIVFIQRLQRTLRSLSYDYNKDAFVGPELTILAEGLTQGGIKKIVFQKEPNNTYWCLKEDNTLLTLTYDSSQDVVGWSQSKLAGKDVKVIDLAVLPSNVYQQDMLLLAVERTINGETKRYLELLSPNFITELQHKDAVFLDCALRLQAEEGVYFDTVSGLDYLEGQTIKVLDEGADCGNYVVENGEVTLDTLVNDIWIGLPYDAYMETLERDYQDKQISTKMSKLRVYKLKLYIERTLGMKVQRLENGTVTTLITFDPSKKTDETPALLTGKYAIEVPSAWDCDYRLKIISDPGMPCIVSGIIIGVEINEL